MRTQEQIQARIDELVERAEAIHTEALERSDGEEALAEGSPERQEWNDANEEIERERENLRQLKVREDRLAELHGSEENRDEPATPAPTRRSRRESSIYDLSSIRLDAGNPEGAASELRSRALKSIDEARFYREGVDEDATRSLLDWHTRNEAADPEGRFARYLLATGSPEYQRAFGKLLAGIPRTREEDAAIALASHAERALSLTGSAGGFAVPYVLDPTLMLTSSGVVNPIRSLARTVSITVDEWRGVTSGAVTAAYEAEATQVADQTPTLAQPTISTEKAQAWVAASIEINQDWSSLQTELAQLFADAKDTLEADKFLNGSGTNEPFGLLTGITNTVNAAAGQSFTLANLYALTEALPPRYRPRGSLLADLAILNKTRQFETAGGGLSGVWEPGGLQPGNPARLLGKPVYEASGMPDTSATGNKFLVYGDFSRFVIVDRVGMTIEVVPHVFGANQRPTGQRGFYCYWRNSSKVVDAAAFRTLLGVS